MRTAENMNIHPIDGSTFMTVITMGFYVATVIFGQIQIDVLFGQITLQSLAAICAILAGVSTFIFNVYRFYKEYKNSQQKKE